MFYGSYVFTIYVQDAFLNATLVDIFEALDLSLTTFSCS